MATPFVRGMTFTSRVATADINSLKFQRRAEIPKSVMAKPFVRGYGEGGNPAYPNRFQSPLIPLFGLYPSSSTFPKRERKRKVYLLGRRAYYHVYCKSFVTLQSPKAPRSLSRKAGGELRACPVPIAIGNGRAASPKSSPMGIRGQFLYAQCGLKPQCAIRCNHQKSPMGDLGGLKGLFHSASLFA